MNFSTISKILHTLPITVSVSAAKPTPLHIVNLHVSNGMTGAQACQQYWPGYPTCIPTHNSDPKNTLSIMTNYGGGTITPGNTAAIVGGAPLQSADVTISNASGKQIFSGSEKNKVGDTCDSTQCTTWK